jgi:threonine/homoserine/homoserine lactone efflux protein
MTKSKTTNQEKTETTKKPRNFNWIYATITVIIGVVCAVLILGLAARGLSTYIQGMSDTARAAGSIVGVALMAFGVASLIKLARR